MAAFRSVIDPRRGLHEDVLHAGQLRHLGSCRRIAAQPVGDNLPGHRVSAQPLSEEAPCRSFVTALLQQHVRLAAQFDEQLIEMPRRARHAAGPLSPGRHTSRRTGRTRSAPTRS
ncbi:protein of unknown function [Paraburkholderia kururiensis]